LSDVVLLDGSGDRKAHYYEEVPVDYVRASDLGRSRDCFTFTLEYGAGHDEIDPFDIAVGRAWEDTHKHDDRYLHPVVRHYRRGTLFDELRLKENLDNDWTDEAEHRKPLREFIAGQLAADSPTRAPDPAEQSTRRPRFVNVRDVEAEARERLNPVHYDYVLSGAQDEVTVRANEAGYSRLTLVPRVLRGAGEPTLGVSLLGCHTSTPILLAPTAFHRLVHPDAELATARAAAATGTIMIAAMLSTVAIEDIAAAARTLAAEPGLWFQLYIQPDLGFTEAIVRRAEAAGCRALVVTSDSPALGRNERNDRNDFHDLPPGLRCENLRELRGGEPGSVRQVSLSPQISWSHLDWLRETSALPILVKGILHPEDAKLAVHRGVDAIVVSNHGGRQLDTAPATVDQLPRIVEAVDGRVPVLLDGGIRRGTDVVKALALGADAVAVGRPALWGLAADGERGVVSVLEILRNEFANALTLCGAASPRDLGRDQVQERPC
jgi:4-hydroxymandelate oxidase